MITYPCQRGISCMVSWAIWVFPLPSLYIGKCQKKTAGTCKFMGKRINELMISVYGKFMDYRGMRINIMGMFMMNDQ